MSHFMTAVIIPKDRAKDAEQVIGELLAPYDENLETEEYDTKCSCVGWKAVCENEKLVEEKFGKWDDLKKEFWKEAFDKYGIKSTHDERCTREISNELDDLWEQKTKERLEWYNSNLTSHPLYNKPDKDCEECDGTGLAKTTYNPDSKWDWWVIGGRWNGEIRAERRRSEDGFNFGEEFHQISENITSVEDYLDQINKENADVPFAIVTPDGEWNEEGTMGWFGIVSNEDKKWDDRAKEILKEYSGKNFAIVGVDAHI
jgi:hypothetical protein